MQPTTRLSRLNPRRLRNKIPIFRIFYSTTFFIATLILAALLLVTPGDHVQQAFEKRQVYHIVTVAAVYLLTLLVALFTYAGRMFKTRTALAAIPGVLQLGDGGADDDGDDHPQGRKAHAKRRKTKAGKPMILGLKVNKLVKSVVQRGLDRSAIISYEGRPRDLTTAPATHRNMVPIVRKRRLRKTHPTRDSPIRASFSDMASQTVAEPIWGNIEHVGWSAPGSKDLPNLHYDPVIAELPNLFEAKAVSLAPVDASYEATAETAQSTGVVAEKTEQPLLDPLVVELLQRPASLGLRDYAMHLTNLGIIGSLDLVQDFLKLYQQARFSGKPLNGREFRALMGMFAEILRQMQPMSKERVDQLRLDAEAAMDNRARSQPGSSVDGVGLGLDVDEHQRSDSQSVSERRRRGSTSNDTVSHHPHHVDAGMHRDEHNGPQASSPSGSHKTERQPDEASITSSSCSILRRQASYYSTSDDGSVIHFADARESLDLPHAYSAQPDE